jgi:hypothetical protein
MTQKIDAETIRQKTREILGEDIDYGYITDDLVAEDAESPDDMEVRSVGKNVDLVVWYGNNARYGTRVINGQTYSVYYFDHGGSVTNANLACGNRVRGAWVRMDMWHHRYLGKCPNGREKWSFSQ